MLRFWGAAVREGKELRPRAAPGSALQLTQVSLGAGAPTGTRASLTAQIGEQRCVICTLCANALDSIRTDLFFDSLEDVVFSVHGTAKTALHLCGNIIEPSSESDARTPVAVSSPSVAGKLLNDTVLSDKNGANQDKGDDDYNSDSDSVMDKASSPAREKEVATPRKRSESSSESDGSDSAADASQHSARKAKHSPRDHHHHSHKSGKISKRSRDENAVAGLLVRSRRDKGKKGSPKHKRHRPHRA